jgi:hypothetical protein
MEGPPMILVRQADSPGHAAAIASRVESNHDGTVINICHADGYNTWFVFFRLNGAWGPTPKDADIQKLDADLAGMPRR